MARVILLVIFLSCGVTASGFAQQLPEQSPQTEVGPKKVWSSADLSIGRRRGCVRVKTTGCSWDLFAPGCVEYMGSGTVIGLTDDRKWIVLSCAHLFHKANKAKIEVDDRIWNEAKIIRVDRQADLSLMTVQYVESVEPVGVAQNLPTQEDELVTNGYPDGSLFIERLTSVTGATEYKWFIDARPIGGESGGGLIGPDGLVGVVVETEREIEQDPTFEPGGRVVSWPVVAKFVATAYPVQKRYEREEPTPLFGRPNPNDRGPNPLPPGRKSKQKEQPVDEVPNPKADLPKEQPAEKLEQEEPIEWSVAKGIILIKRQESFDFLDWLLRPLQKLSTEDTGLGKLARNLLNDSTDGKLDTEVVYQRAEPERYAKIIEASGVREGQYISSVILIKSQKKSMFDIFHKMTMGFVERAAKSKLGSVPVEIVLEATSPEVFAETQEAIDFEEPAGIAETGIVAVIIGMISGFIAEWLKKKKEVI